MIVVIFATTDEFRSKSKNVPTHPVLVIAREFFLLCQTSLPRHGYLLIIVGDLVFFRFSGRPKIEF